MPKRGRQSLLKRGAPVPAVDLVISATAVRLNLQLISRDRHLNKSSPW